MGHNATSYVWHPMDPMRGDIYSYRGIGAGIRRVIGGLSGWEFEDVIIDQEDTGFRCEEQKVLAGLNKKQEENTWK